MENTMSSGYILGISRGHNAGACLINADGEIVFAMEEERISRVKYDGGPYACMMKVLEYTDKLDYIFVSHTQSLEETGATVEFIGDNLYAGLARKMGLIEHKNVSLRDHPQVVDLAHQHHKIHAACAFYRSGFDQAAAVIVDGAGSVEWVGPNALWEVETIIDCGYPSEFKTVYKHQGTREPFQFGVDPDHDGTRLGEDNTHYSVVSDSAGIVKVYEAVTEFCGFSGIEAGKTMGLFPYGSPNSQIPNLFRSDTVEPVSDRNVIIPTYPGSAWVNTNAFDELRKRNVELNKDPQIDKTTIDVCRDLAYALQTQTQEQVLNLIIRASEMTGHKNIVLSGGYGLNCVANYYYLDKIKDHGIKLFVEPISNDGGTAIGVALWGWHMATKSNKKHQGEIYLGPKYEYSEQQILDLADQYGAFVEEGDDKKVVELMTSKNIVAYFQGRSENGPRALGNRSLLFDPRFEDGKDFVNQIKRREYFRPFAGSILQEDVHDWFDLRGMDESPHMMYAVHCKEGVAEKIPSIIHVDGSCRIQTVKEEDNPLYHRLISEFKKQTDTPIVFNTSFNLGGEPLVETLDDALRTLKESKIEYLYLPEYGKLITVSNWEQV